MYRKKSYLRQYRRIYLKENTTRTKRNFFKLFAIVICATVTFLAYVFVQIESASTEQQNEASLVINQAVSVKKKIFRTDFKAWNQTCDWNLIIVNNGNCIPRIFVPSLRLFGDIEIDERITSSLGEMLSDAANDGMKLWISTGYRSLARQEQLFNRKVDDALASGLNKENAIKRAWQETAPQGYSEHNTGLAVDFNAADTAFAGTPEYEWLTKNSTKYGFILRYPQEKEGLTGRPFEPAHFRYVGEEHAKIIVAQNLCLEEYISGLMR